MDRYSETQTLWVSERVGLHSYSGGFRFINELEGYLLCAILVGSHSTPGPIANRA